MQLSTVYTQRLQEAEQRGIAIAQQRLIRNLLSKGMTIEEIAELTELSSEEVTEIINQDEQ